MSSWPPPNEGSNPYVPPTQYSSSPEYATPGAYQQQYQQYATPAPAYMPQPQYMAVPMADPKAGQALAGMILGIAGLFISFFGLVPLLGLIFSIIGMKSYTRKGMAVAGLVTSIIGLVFAVFLTLIIIAALTAAATMSTP